ncbi:LLM class flavin-dependent oxidoreductase [Conexibacter sp. DBS9H8]|uniref:LLM class flavin-dependent oxidoreductase n=1 Tax=Conexibacter sp. DBS9H8 TaxID=2937801 RepID=UPI002010B1F7|nr:LLM class flavin-dependent oxidoreductase [Conexibacter sp. DBS9H8]
MSSPRVGVLLPTFDATHRSLTPPVLEGARLIEAAGFDGAWVGDHLACPSPLLDAVTCLGAAAAVTQRITLGFSVLLLGLRPPAWTAKCLVTLDALAPGGRLALGVGVGGEFPEEFAAAGVPLARRGRRVDEILEALPDLLCGRPVSYHGSVLELEVHGPHTPERGLSPAISQLPPVYVGGRGEAALARAARHADFWMPMWLSPDSITRRVERLGELAERAGRPTPALATLVLVHADADRARGRRAAEAHLRGQYGMGLDRVEHWTGLGDAAAIAEQLTGYLDAGVREFVLMPLGADPLGQIEALADVADRLRAHGVQPQTATATATP